MKVRFFFFFFNRLRQIEKFKEIDNDTVETIKDQARFINFSLHNYYHQDNCNKSDNEIFFVQFNFA